MPKMRAAVRGPPSSSCPDIDIPEPSKLQVCRAKHGCAPFRKRWMGGGRQQTVCSSGARCFHHHHHHHHHLMSHISYLPFHSSVLFCSVDSSNYNRQESTLPLPLHTYIIYVCMYVCMYMFCICSERCGVVLSSY